MNWQPIETSPKDGTQFIGYSKKLGKTPYVICWWSKRAATGEPFICVLGIGELYGNFVMKAIWPTHWMPLPPEPEEGT